jgi:D-alanyl-D-alanine carboxypeptidase
VTDQPTEPSTVRVRHRGPTPQQRRNRIIATIIGVAVVAGLIVTTVVVFSPRAGDPVAEPSDTPTPDETPTPTPTPTPTFDKGELSIDDPTSVWVVVNKQRPLQPQDYAPADLVGLSFIEGGQMRAEAAGQVEALAAQFTAETGLQFRTISSYRSYSRQVDVYNGWVSRLGQEAADLTSARPGHSEHQTGMVIDFGSVPAQCDLDQCFADTTQGSWLATNAYKWGFILRYPDGYTHITGYEFEPWHYRYVGVELATEMHDTGVATLEEFFGLPAAPTY